MRFVDYRNDAKLFKALSDENRLQILAQLNAEEKCACVLLEKLAISQPTLSHHMKILCESGVVTGRKEGKWMHYSISEDGLENVMNYLDELIKNTKMGDGNCESCR